MRDILIKLDCFNVVEKNVYVCIYMGMNDNN